MKTTTDNTNGSQASKKSYLDLFVTFALLAVLVALVLPMYQAHAERENRALQDIALARVKTLASTLFDNSHSKALDVRTQDEPLGDFYLLSIRRECDGLRQFSDEYGEDLPVPHREMLTLAGKTCAEIGKRALANGLNHTFLAEASGTLLRSKINADERVNGERRRKEQAAYEEEKKNAKNSVGEMSSWQTPK